MEWLQANWQWLVSAIISLISLGAWIYAKVVHTKSSVRLDTLEAKKEAEAELLAQLKELSDALNKGGK